MLNRIIKHAIIPAGILPFKILDNDTVTVENETVKAAVEEYKSTKETGWDRLYYMFSKELVYSKHIRISLKYCLNDSFIFLVNSVTLVRNLIRRYK